MDYVYRDVPRLGTVKVSIQARERVAREKIPEPLFRRALYEPPRDDIHKEKGVLLREREGLRLVIRTDPISTLGAMLIQSVYWIRPPIVPRR